MSSSKLDALCVSAPASLMLMGEHAVLHGSHSLCAAIDQRMRLTLTPGTSREFSIQSSLGQYEGSLGDFEVCKPFEFLLKAIERAAPKKGFHLHVQSDFSSTIGFGSSAAVTVCMVSLLRALNQKAFDRAAILEESLTVVREIQGKASGSDIAASIFGGVVHYRAAPIQVEPLVPSLALAVCYAGYKTPTIKVIEKVDSLRYQHPDRFAELFHLIDQCVEDATQAIRKGDIKKLGQLFNIHHGLQSALGCSDETLEYLIYQLRGQPEVTGAKISGSGLGDCVISLGNPQAKVNGYDHFSVKIDAEGVRFET